MSGIFGLIHLDGAPVTAEDLQPMRVEMAHWGPDGVRTWTGGCAGLGQCVLFNTPEALGERLPRVSGEPRFVFTGEARIDNRDELFDALGVPTPNRSAIADGDLMLSCYAQWGPDAVHRMFGDWSFAAWHPDERRLCLARDHHGQTALYYFRDARRFVFASDRKALLALPGVPAHLNEVFLAQMMVAWREGFQGEGTSFREIHRLPPAHRLHVNESSVWSDRYWRLEDTPEVRLSSPQESVELVSGVFQSAVRSRLRSYRPVGSMLSAGLDSGAVVAVAARELRQRSQPLLALTAAPYLPMVGIGPERIGDEWELAHATAQFVGGINHVRVEARGTSPLAGVRQWLEIQREPVLAAENLYWLMEVLATARAHGVGTLLTGRGGNASISWEGPRRRVSAADRLRVAESLEPVRRVYRRLRFAVGNRELPFGVHRVPCSVIDPEFARRVGLRGLMAHAGYSSFESSPNDARLARAAAIMPGRSIVGARNAAYGAAFGLEVRDPTEDVQVLRATMSIPADHWVGPAGRWMARQMTRGILPDTVRLNEKRGKQAADLVSRLRLHRTELDEALRSLEATVDRGAGFVELPRLRSAFERLIAGEHATFGDGLRLVRGLSHALFTSGSSFGNRSNL